MQLLNEAGAQTDRAITLVPRFGGYFRAVKGVEEYTPQQITLNTADGKLYLGGEDMRIDKYSEQDLFIRGDIKEARFE